MRFAFVPTSPPPTRESDRTFTRRPPSAGLSRMTTSSLKPNQNVVSVASIRPAAGSAATKSHYRITPELYVAIPRLRTSEPAQGGRSTGLNATMNESFRQRFTRDGYTLATHASEIQAEPEDTRKFRPDFDAEGWPSGRWRWS
jgi:hypothetical protein